MTAIQFLSLGRRLANLYAALCAPICRQYGINQTGFDILLFCANNPEHNTARDLGTVRGIKRGIASIGVETLIRSGFLERQDDPQDRRIRRLIPTEKAAPVIADGALRRYADRRHHAGRVRRFAQHNVQAGELPEQCLRIGRG